MIKSSFILERKVVRVTSETDVQIKEMGMKMLLRLGDLVPK